MKCPSCEAELKLSEREGIEIDYCPGCRGVWLDRGELDKIIDRASFARRRDHDDDRDDDDHDDLPREARGQVPQRRRRSWLSEMFDFGD